VFLHRERPEWLAEKAEGEGHVPTFLQAPDASTCSCVADGLPGAEDRTYIPALNFMFTMFDNLEADVLLGFGHVNLHVRNAQGKEPIDCARAETRALLEKGVSVVNGPRPVVVAPPSPAPKPVVVAPPEPWRKPAIVRAPMTTVTGNLKGQPGFGFLLGQDDILCQIPDLIEFQKGVHAMPLMSPAAVVGQVKKACEGMRAWGAATGNVIPARILVGEFEACSAKYGGNMALCAKELRVVAIRLYTMEDSTTEPPVHVGEFYTQLNMRLRNMVEFGELSISALLEELQRVLGDLFEYAILLLDALRQMPTTDVELPLLRGAKMSKEALKAIRNADGKALQFTSFTSFSEDFELAKKFPQKSPGPGEEKVLWQLNAVHRPAISSISAIESEREVLMHPGSTTRIVGLSRMNNRWCIRLRDIELCEELGRKVRVRYVIQGDSREQEQFLPAAMKVAAALAFFGSDIEGIYSAQGSGSSTRLDGDATLGEATNERSVYVVKRRVRAEHASEGRRFACEYQAPACDCRGAAKHPRKGRRSQRRQPRHDHLDARRHSAVGGLRRGAIVIARGSSEEGRGERHAWLYGAGAPVEGRVLPAVGRILARRLRVRRVGRPSAFQDDAEVVDGADAGAAGRCGRSAACTRDANAVEGSGCSADRGAGR
jgi:hypothetical protein